MCLTALLTPSLFLTCSFIFLNFIHPQILNALLSHTDTEPTLLWILTASIPCAYLSTFTVFYLGVYFWFGCVYILSSQMDQNLAEVGNPLLQFLYIFKTQRSSVDIFKVKAEILMDDTCIKSLIYSKLVFHSITRPFCYPHCEMVLLVKITNK